MLIKNQHKFYIYKRTSEKIDGESNIKWEYKKSYYLNDQQDTNELDKTSSGLVDFDILKLRTNKEVDIEKTDGIAYKELNIDNSIGYTIETPQYVVESINKIGNSTLFICKTYNGE